MEGRVDQRSGKIKEVFIEYPDIAIWKSMTRLILKKHPIQTLLYHLDDIVKNVVDKQEEYPSKCFKEGFEFPKKRGSVIKQNLKKSAIRKKINDNLKIIEVAESYGIIIKNKKALCPFHSDKDPSLSFSDEKNVFNCFGCGIKGDIVTFIKLMEEKEGDNKTGSRSKGT